jgi:hypothetical protein
MRLSAFAIVIAAALTPAANASIVAEILLDTSPLMSHAAGPFSLSFQLSDGSGMNDGNNTAMLNGFQFQTGGPAGSPMLFGGASGSLGAGVTLTDNDFFNAFVQQFTPGATLRFFLELSTNVDAGVPDQFSFAILDSSGAEIPTKGLGEVGSDALLLIDTDSAAPAIRTFGADELRFPAAGGDPIEMEAPQVIPEPGSILLMSAGLGLLVTTNRFRRAR